MSTDETVMRYKGFFARIMEAARLKGDQTFGLPPGNPLSVYFVDQFVNPPENWMKGPGCFVVPVKPDKGLWFDWTPNSSMNTAIIPTVKGCNPITGMPTSGFHMERYENKCPKHGIEFMGDRFCKECGYKWPFGNYVAAPNRLWLDGWRNSSDGTVRQFFFTAEELRDIATHRIGKENTVPAFGFAFYQPKEPRMQPSTREVVLNYYLGSSSTGTDWSYLNSGDASYTIWWASGSSGSVGLGTDHPDMYGEPEVGEVKTSGTIIGMAQPLKAIRAKSFTMGSAICSQAVGQSAQAAMYSAQILAEPVVLQKEVSVGAGVKIHQDLQQDPYPLDSWKDAPEAVMTVYFVFQEEFDQLKAGGMRDLSDVKDGMLAGLPVG